MNRNRGSGRQRGLVVIFAVWVTLAAPAAVANIREDVTAEDLVGGADQFRDIQPVKRPILVDVIEILKPAWLVPVVFFKSFLLDFRHPVNELVAGLIDVVGEALAEWLRPWVVR